MVGTGEANLRRELPDGTVFDLSAYDKTGILLSLFLTHCEEGFQAGKATPER